MRNGHEILAAVIRLSDGEFHGARLSITPTLAPSNKQPPWSGSLRRLESADRWKKGKPSMASPASHILAILPTYQLITDSSAGLQLCWTGMSAPSRRIKSSSQPLKRKRLLAM